MEGGSAGVGTVFKLDPLGNLSILHSFGAGLAPDGQYPCVGVIRVGGILYGTTNEGGAYNNGAVYRVDTAGNEKLIDSFALDASQGLEPCAMLDHDAAGNLFGTTSQGGTYQWGTIFKIAPNGKATILYNFTGGAADGGLPYAALTHDAAGNFYSIAQVGGAYGYGTVFKLDPAGNFTVLHAFTGGADGGFGLGDAGSHDSVILDAAGNLYGTAPLGGSAFGSSGNGVVFKITP